jgi:hypothetical protein
MLWCKLVKTSQIFLVTDHERSINPTVNTNPVSGH